MLRMSHISMLMLASIGISTGLDAQTVLNHEVSEDYARASAHRENIHDESAYTTHVDNLSDMVHKGGALFYDIMHGNEIYYKPYPDNSAHFQDMRNLIMFLYASSIHKTQTQDGANEGGFLVKDPHKRLYSFLRKYGSEEVDHHGNAYSIGYRFVVAHRNKGPLNDYGFAITPCEALTSQHTNFPAGQRTLFFQYDPSHKATYIRPENTNRYLNSSSRDTHTHLSERLSGRASRVGGFVSSMWNKAVGNGDDAPECHKPHIPHDISSSYKTIVNAYGENLNNIDLEDPYSLSAMYRNLKKIYNLNAYVPLYAITELANTINKIETAFDHIDIRYGNEIVFGNEILPYAYYYWMRENRKPAGNQLEALRNFAHLNHEVYRLRNPYADQRFDTKHTIEGTKNSRRITLNDVKQRFQRVIAQNSAANYQLFNNSNINSYMSDLSTTYYQHLAHLTDHTEFLRAAPLETSQEHLPQ